MKEWADVESLVDVEIRGVVKQFWDIGYYTQEGCSGHYGKQPPYLIFLPKIFREDSLYGVMYALQEEMKYGLTVKYQGNSLVLSCPPRRYEVFQQALERLLAWLRDGV